MNPIRVLVVDDSVVVRRLIANAIAETNDIEVVAYAPNGRVALAKLDLLHPDVVVLDTEMPELDGLETLTEIRKTRRALPVIMFSTLTGRGAISTLSAFARGASDYVAKPTTTGSLHKSMDLVRTALLPKIRAFGRRRTRAFAMAPSRVRP